MLPRDENRPSNVISKWLIGCMKLMDNEWFIEKFERIAELPDAVPRMRELVLELAFQGAFHKVISWQKSELGKVCDRIHYGYTAKADQSDKKVRMLRITDIQNNQVNWDTVPGCDISATELPKYKLHQGDILIARTGGTVGKSFLIREQPPTAVFASYLIRIVPNNKVLSDYLKRFLESPAYWKQLHKGARGAAQANVNGKTLSQMNFPLPPLSEQRRIVSKVEELMGICDALEAQQQEREERKVRLVTGSLKRFSETPSVENLSYLFHESYSVSPSDLRKTILSLAVQGKLVPQDPNDEPASKLIHRITSEKSNLIKNKVIRATSAHTKRDHDCTDGELPNGWMWVQIDEITSVGTGSTPLKSQRDFYEKGDVPWVTSAATNNEFIATPEQFVTQKAVRECNLRIYPKGSLLIALYGQGKTRGQVGQLMFDSTTNQACAVLEFFASGASVRDYIRLFFHKKYDELRGQAAGGAQPNLSGGMIRLTRVPIPPLAEQRRIVSKVKELMSMVDELEKLELQTRHQGAALLDAIVHRLSASAG